MGTLFKRGDVWFANYVDRDGRRHKVSTRTTYKSVAVAKLRDLELATTDRGADRRPTETLLDALKYFVEVTHAASSDGTVRCYQQKARHLARLLGHVMLDELRRETLDRYVATRVGDESAHPHSVHKEIVVLRGALKAAAARGRFHGDLGIVPTIDPGYTPRTTYLTPQQFERLAQHIVPPIPRNAGERWIARRDQLRRRRLLYCMLIAFASPRRGELEALRPGHVDLARGVIRIPRGKTIGRPVAIHPMLLPWLEARIAENDDKGDDTPLVEPWSNVTRDLVLACERAGVPRVTPNDLRRTFASWLVQAGESLYVVSRLLGHSSTRMVERVYGQLDEATLASAIQKLPWDAGGTSSVSAGGRPGRRGRKASLASSPVYVEDPAVSRGSVVPRVGIEPTTRGFSGRCSMGQKQDASEENHGESGRQLRIVR